MWPWFTVVFAVMTENLAASPILTKPGNSLDVAYSRFRLAALNRIVSG